MEARTRAPASMARRAVVGAAPPLCRGAGREGEGIRSVGRVWFRVAGGLDLVSFHLWRFALDD
jgi:hypothetical protein